MWENVKNSNASAYQALYSLCYESGSRNWAVFMNDFHKDTHVDEMPGETAEQRCRMSCCTDFFA